MRTGRYGETCVRHRWIAVTTIVAIYGFASLVAKSALLVAPPNDYCENAVPLTLNRTTKGTTVGAQENYLSDPACFTGIGQTPTTALGRDIVFSFTAPAVPNPEGYSFRIVQQNPFSNALSSQNEVLYAIDGASGCPSFGQVSSTHCANRQQSLLNSPTGFSRNASEELTCLPMTAGQIVYLFFDDAAAGNAGGAMSLEPIECHSEVEPNGTPATATPFVCGMSGSSDVSPVAHCYLGTRAGQVCTRSTPLDPIFVGQTDLDCDPRCDVGPNAGQPCTTHNFCNPGSDQGATCAGTCQVESTCINTATGSDTGVACTPVCVGSSLPAVNGRFCSTLSGCPGGGTCTQTPLVPTPGATCTSGQTCGRQFNEGDEDFFSLGAPLPPGSKVFAGIDAKSANDDDWRMRITTTTSTLQFDDDDGTSRNGPNAPEIAGAVVPANPPAGTATFVKISRTAPRTSTPYELYAIVRPPLADAQVEDESGPVGNDTYYGWPGDVIIANPVTAGGYVKGNFDRDRDFDCFKFIVHEGALMEWYGDGNPARIAGATSIATLAQPIIYDAEPAGISNLVFAANPRKNTLSNVPSAGLAGLTPAVTSSFFQWRASYSGMHEVCYFDASSTLGLGTPAHPSPWAGSLGVDCGPLGPQGADLVTDVSVTQNDPVGPVQTGSLLTYVITVTNSSTDIAQEVQLVDVLDPNVTFVSLVVDDGFSGLDNNPRGTNVTGTGFSNNTACITYDHNYGLPTAGTNDAPISCINTSMAPGAVTTYTLTVQVNNCIGAGVQIRNVATITTVSTDPESDNNTWTTEPITTTEDGTCNDLACDATGCIPNLCTSDHCDATGACVSEPLDCDDHNSCTTDCDPASGCVTYPNPGQACDDGILCTDGDTCDASGVSCISGPLNDALCDDGNPATADICEPEGCEHIDSEERIRGTVYTDIDSSGSPDGGEPRLQTRIVTATRDDGHVFSGLTDVQGDFDLTVLPGQYTVRPVSRPGESFTPTSRSVPVDQNDVLTGQDFGRVVVHDLGVRLYAKYTSPTNRPCPNVAMQLCTRYDDFGDFSEPTARVRLQLPPAGEAAYLSSTTSSNCSFPPASLDPPDAGGTITWDISGIPSGGGCTVCVDLNVQQPLGATLSGTASIYLNPSLGQDAVTGGASRNQELWVETVRCSYDPNDMQVTPEGCGPSGAIPSGETLTYLVRFQNLGNAPATDVTVSDTLDEDMDETTLEFVDSSHPLSNVALGGNRSLVFSFSGIELPGAQKDEPGSHGFILFRATTRPGLAAGTAITNGADIVFDLNAPVVTNTVLNTIAADTDGDGVLDPCDNCPTAPNPDQGSTDGDAVPDACDNCPLESNQQQVDLDNDGEGDICDLDDGLIYILASDRDHIEWQDETGPTSWNVYEGDVYVLRSTGNYTQAPGSNPLADRHCGLTSPSVEDLEVPPLGGMKFALVTGVQNGSEGSLGVNSAQVERPNTNPCP